MPSGVNPGARDPDDLPYAELDILGAAAGHLAGEAVLADLTRGWCDAREEDGTLAKADAAALDRFASAGEDRLLGELACPARGLSEVALKLALALRVGWYDLRGASTYGEAALLLLGTALSDVILLREAEARRRAKLAEPEVTTPGK